MIQPWQAPVPVVGAGGRATPEWLRWLRQLLAASGTIDTNAADITILQGLIATLQAAVTALENAPSEALTLETNYALNGSQTKLDLVAGANIVLSDNGVGDITISSTGSSTPNYVEETPAGTLNGLNTAFTLSYTPTNNSLTLYLNGVEQVPSVDFTLSSSAIAFTVAPKNADQLIAQYTH